MHTSHVCIFLCVSFWGLFLFSCFSFRLLPLFPLALIFLVLFNVDFWHGLIV